MSTTPDPALQLQAFDEFERLLPLEGADLELRLKQLHETNPALHAEVSALIEAGEAARARDFLATRVTRTTSPGDSAPGGELQPGADIGVYRLERPLGQGGMGEVWLARRADGLFEAPVALKLMHLHLHLSRSTARARFVREGRILGELTHSNVGRLLDAGALPNGQLYLALEYIDGERLDWWCDDRRLDLHGRVRLFLQVCEAVAHAHAHLVVHRDLKPSNILVTNDGVVKLLDFGIAKLVEDESTGADATELTRLGGRALTPEYAAPEQVGDGTITVATDVYSLGVILYVLLAGVRPYGAAGTSAAALEREVLETEPRPPSAAPTQIGTADLDRAGLRSTTPRKLRETLRGDLDTIIGKALKKLPEERYPSVAALAADLRAWLEDRPIGARPDSFGYRSAKFVRRHRLDTGRVQITIAATALVALAALSSVWQWQQTEKQHALDRQAQATRIAQLYDNGRRELLAHNEARAAVLLNEVYKAGVDTPALRYMLGRAMRTVDAQMLRIRTPSAAKFVEPSPDGTELMSIGEDGHLRVYDVATGGLGFEQPLDMVPNAYFGAGYSPRGHRIWIDGDHPSPPTHRLSLLDSGSSEHLPTQLALAEASAETYLQPFDSTGQRAVFVNSDRSIGLADDSRRPASIAGRYSAASFCADSTDLLLAGAADGSVEIIGIDGSHRRRFSGLHESVVALASTPGCRVVAAGTTTGTVRVWDGASGEVLMSGGHNGSITDLRFNHGGSRLMTLSQDAVAIWGARSGALIYLAKLLDPTRSVAMMRPDGNSLALLQGEHLSLLDPSTGLENYSLDGHLGPPVAFAMDATSRQLLSAGPDGSLVLWKFPSDMLAEFKEESTELAGAPLWERPAIPVGISADGKWLLTAGATGSASLWDASTLKKAAALSAVGSPASAFAFRPHSRQIAVGNWNQAVRIWDPESGSIPMTTGELGGRVLLLSYDSTGEVLAASVSGQRVILLDAEKGNEIVRFQRDEARASTFSPSGTRFAFGVDGTVRLWDVGHRTFIWSTPLPEHAERFVGPIQFSPDGSRLLVTSRSNTACLLDALDGRILQCVSDPSLVNISVVSFDSQGKQIIIGSGSKSLALWRPEDNRLLKLSGHAAPVRAASFDHSGSILLSGAEDGVVKIWDAATGDPIDSFGAQAGAIQWDYARFTADGSRILTGGTDGTAHLRDVRRENRSPDALHMRLRCRVAWVVDPGTTTLLPEQIDERCPAREAVADKP